ncbi:S9 family peptidase [Bacillus sp. ISL-51]|uniref:S9 family peptidase n=1 Tax=Bacteria TaxID=2 RepID=UPI001BE8F0F8|nr:MULTISPECIES: S9 family peptidase [Bacteria]MBT2574840.1 S9 family peptidase [Bacillus sp. ISL-51]MBT2635719.1 S9 family peptidase [Bacillus sp. ISL-26]MBT2714203.1 S9 family peptidase [Pseudomonas sp. ISL-88]
MKKLMTEEDIAALVSVTDPQYAPDGKRAAYVQTKVNQEQDSYSSAIMMYDLETGTSSRWTYGDKKNTSPRWSPDGSRLAFVSDRDGGVPQLFIMNAGGGEAEKVTDIPWGVSDPIWSPDGKSVLLSVSLTSSERADDQEKRKGDEFEPVDVQTITYKRDGRGLLKGSWAQLVLVNLETGNIQQLTDHEADHYDAAFSPTGEWLVFTANLTDQGDASKPSDVYVMEQKSGRLTQITPYSGSFGSCAFSPDGSYIAILGHENEYRNATLEKAWLYDMKNERLSCLTDMLDVHLSDALIADSLIGGVTPRPVWTNDGQGFYVLGTEQGSTGIYYISIDGLAYPIRLEDEYVNGFTFHPDQKSYIAVIAKPSRPSELYSIPLGQGEEKQLTAANDCFVEEHIISVPENLQYETKDGLTVNGWFLKPARFEENKTYPLILYVHGGPHMMYGHTYFHEFQVLAAEGYAVVYVNPRGSHGYGQDFVNRVRGDYGGGDYRDVMQAVDEAADAYPFIDRDRLGVTGGSYGGFMTNWIVGQTDRFKAAVTQRSISNWFSFHGVSDIGYFFTDWQLGHDLFEETDKLWERSPIKYALQVTTPLLILHGERDDRCPIEQAEQLFTALKKLNKTTAFVRFPGATHELSRSGRPKQRMKRLNYICSWFDQYL